jgi:hypothetical protein
MSPSSATANFFTAVFPYRSFDPHFPPAERQEVVARGEVSSKLMNVALPGNDAVPIRLRKTRLAMGEIVDLEGYRRLRRRREAEAKKGKRGDAPGDEKDEAPSAASTAKRAGPGRSGSKGAAKTGGDDPKID